MSLLHILSLFPVLLRDEALEERMNRLGMTGVDPRKKSRSRDTRRQTQTLVYDVFELGLHFSKYLERVVQLPGTLGVSGEGFAEHCTIIAQEVRVYI